MRIIQSSIVIWVVFALGATALAQVPGFQINRIEGVGVLEGELDDRITDDFMINYADCQLYMGETETTVVDEDPVDEVTTDVITEPVDDLVSQDWAEEDTAESQDIVMDNRVYRFSGKADEIATTRRILVTWSVDTLTGYDYAIKVGTCSESSDLADEETDSCRYLVSRTSLNSYTNNELYINLWELLPDGCLQGDTGETAVYFFFQFGEDTYTRQVETVKFLYDFEAPVAPQNMTLAPGESNVKVSWDDEINSEDVEYRVYWGTQFFDDDGRDGVDSKGSIATTDYQVNGLTVGTIYYFGVTAVDDYDNESTLTTVSEDTPVAVDDFWEHYKKSGGQETGGYCFIATAAWGSHMQPAVGVLQAFRDRVLLPNAWGRAFVDLYYTVGPLAARYIQDKPVLRSVVRVSLLPLVALAWVTQEVPPAARYPLTLFFFLGLAWILTTRRKLGDELAEGRCRQ